MPLPVMAVEWAFMLATVAFALWRGDATVRLTALIYTFIELGIVAAETLPAGLKPHYLHIDLVGAAAMLVVAVRVRRDWLVAGCAFRLLIIGTHVAFRLGPQIDYLTYLYALNAWLMLAYATLLRGAFEAHQAPRSTELADAT